MLFIGERTVESHVQGILNKLGFHSRVQIAAWVAENRSPWHHPEKSVQPSVVSRMFPRAICSSVGAS